MWEVWPRARGASELVQGRGRRVFLGTPDMECCLGPPRRQARRAGPTVLGTAHPRLPVPCPHAPLLPAGSLCAQCGQGGSLGKLGARAPLPACGSRPQCVQQWACSSGTSPRRACWQGGLSATWCATCRPGRLEGHDCSLRLSTRTWEGAPSACTAECFWLGCGFWKVPGVWQLSPSLQSGLLVPGTRGTVSCGSQLSPPRLSLLRPRPACTPFGKQGTHCDEQRDSVPAGSWGAVCRALCSPLSSPVLSVENQALLWRWSL